MGKAKKQGLANMLKKCILVASVPIVLLAGQAKADNLTLKQTSDKWLFGTASPLSINYNKETKQLGYPISDYLAVKPERISAKNRGEVYVKTARKYYNSLGPYNSKIQEVSVGPVFGGIDSIGIGYSKSLSDKLYANIEFNANKQRLDAIKESNGLQEIYGSNTKLEASIEPGIKYDIPITKSTTLQAGVNVPINFIYMATRNEDSKNTSLTPILEIKPSIALKQTVGKWFVEAGASIRKALTKSNDLDTSAAEIFINAGKNLGEKK